ncbi:MAG: hypothetical protein ACREOO_17520 [bacterium]
MRKERLAEAIDQPNNPPQNANHKLARKRLQNTRKPQLVQSHSLSLPGQRTAQAAR